MKTFWEMLYTVNDLFANFDVEKIKGQGNLARQYKFKDKKHLATKIFTTAFKMAMDDVIDGDVEIRISEKYDAFITMESVDRADIKKTLRHGNYADVDLLQSNFKLWRPMMVDKTNAANIKIQICVDESRKERITEKTNQGYSYR